MRLFTLSLLLITTTLLTAQVSQLSDEFNDPSTLSDWLDITTVEGWGAQHLETFNIDTEVDDHLFLMPHTSSWFQNLRATLLHKMVEGDFVLTTEVRATNRANDDIPGGQYSLAGLMIRKPVDYPNGALNDWQEGNENYIFHALGFAALNHPTCPGCPGPHFEIKTTTNSNSNLQVTTAPSNHVQIRMARIGETVVLLYAPIGGDFIVRNRYCRSDFEDIMQVGFVTYTDWQKVSTYNNNATNRFFQNSHVLQNGVENDPNAGSSIPFAPDLRAEFAFARFNEVSVPTAFQGMDLCDENEVSNEDLLTFLGYASTAALAIDNLDFTAQQEGESITLNWSDNSDNIDHYIIEHRSQDTDFQPINNHPTHTTGIYSFTHHHPKNGANYYRIGQIKSNGNIAYSEVIAINFIATHEVVIVPNPFNTTTNLGIYLEQAASVSVMVYDSYGRPIEVLLEKTHLDKGAQQITWQTKHVLPKGMYWIQVQIDGDKIWKKVLRQ